VIAHVAGVPVEEVFGAAYGGGAIWGLRFLVLRFRSR
jgi:hypothetical protein